MAGHRLRREIITTAVVNEVVNRGGISFLFRAVEETGASLADIVRAFVVVREVYGLRDLWRAVEALDNQVPIAAQTALYLEVRRLVDRAVRWLVTHRRSPIDVTAEIDAAAARRLGPAAAAWTSCSTARSRRSCGPTRPTCPGRASRRTWPTGRPGSCTASACWTSSRWRTERGRDVHEVATVYYLLSDRFRVDDLLSQISALPRDDRWQTMARMALRYDLYAALAALTAQVLASAGVRHRGGPGRVLGGRERGEHRPGQQRHGRLPATAGPTWRRCPCCCARSAPWSRPPPADQFKIRRQDPHNCANVEGLGALPSRNIRTVVWILRRPPARWTSDRRQAASRSASARLVARDAPWVAT